MLGKNIPSFAKIFSIIAKTFLVNGVEMQGSKAEIIAQLERSLLPLQGFKPIRDGHAVDVGLGSIKYAFPNASFPLGAVHEFCCNGVDDFAATGGFVAGIIGKLMQGTGVCLWISSSRTVFPPALISFGIDPEKIIFVDIHKQKEVVWAMEEALKCQGLVAVVAEVPDLTFTASRRLQLAVEQSRVTGFVLRLNPRNLSTTACVTRWKITSIQSASPTEMPGVGFPRWNVELLKVRNGKPGIWQLEWKAGSFRLDSPLSAISLERQKKTG